MVPEHPRSGVPHDRLDLLAPLPLVTMHRAFGARGFLFPEVAAIQTLADISQQRLTVRAQRAAVVVVAMDADHGRDRLPLTRQPTIRESPCIGCGLHRGRRVPAAARLRFPIIGIRPVFQFGFVCM